MMYLKKSLLLISIITFIFITSYIYTQKLNFQKKQITPTPSTVQKDYWFLLHRKTNREDLFQGVPGDKTRSTIIKTFKVKTGIPGERPTPLPKLAGKDYWLLIEKHPEPNNPETAPYFLTLNIPAPLEYPYGPKQYTECNGQCNWTKPGNFGLHGIGDNPDKLSEQDKGSSGCIRHTDKDITYLYNLLTIEKKGIRYYIEDN